MSKIENKILDFIQKHMILIFLIIITILALYLRWIFGSYRSDDYRDFLEKWFLSLKNNGGLFAIKSYKGDYNAPYITIFALLTYIPLKPILLIKGVSIFFDFILAMSSALLASKILKNSKNKPLICSLVYSVVLFLPTVFLNSSAWAQCDSIYTSFVILSLAYLIDEKYSLSFILLGCAFAFKLQFIFILPLYLLVYFLNRKFSIFNFLLIPIVNFILCLPAIILGKPIKECFLVYINQTSSYKKFLTLNFPNIYKLLPNRPEYFRTVGLIITIVIFGIILFYLLYKKVKFDNEKIMQFGLLSIILATYFLPNMHERYMYMADVISVLYCLIYKRKYWMAIVINLVSMFAYFPFLFRTVIFDLKYVSIVYIIFISVYIYLFFSDLTKNDKE